MIRVGGISVAAVLLIALASQTSCDSGPASGPENSVGQLTVAVSGLPPGASSTLSITGVSGVQTPTLGGGQPASKTLILQAGSYSITVPVVSAASATCTPVPGVQTVVVTAGGNVSAVSTYTCTAESRMVTFNNSGTGGGGISVNGAASRSLPFNQPFAVGTSITIQAVPISGSTFTGWSGAVTGSSNPTSFTVNGNTTITAGFSSTPANYTVTFGNSGTGGGGISVNGAASRSLPFNQSFAAGTSITIQAVPISGSTFTGWSGAVTGSANPTSFTVNGDATVTAGFR